MLAPSDFLPTLRPSPSPSTLATYLLRLTRIFSPDEVIINLVDIEGEGQTTGLSGVDAYEVQFVRAWGERVVAIGTKELARGGSLAWEDVVEQTASLLAMLSGHCAAGPSTRTFILPSFLPLPAVLLPTALPAFDPASFFPTPPPTRPPSTSPLARSPLPTLPISLKIRDTTLLSSSTGFRTWGSAPLLARLISTEPSAFFPVERHGEAPLLRVLELGSGTGLVGLTAAAVLGRLSVGAEVTLTDYEPAILDNLRHNLALNPSLSADVTTKTNVSELDWTTFYAARDSESSTHRQFDTILGADLIFEPCHVALVHATVSALLRFPSSCSPRSPPPTFHLALPLRSTHSAEHTAFDTVFAPDLPSEERRYSMDGDGRRWRLVTRERRDAKGGDGFGRMAEADQVDYRVYWIGWEQSRK